MLVEIRHLRIVRTVADRGSITRAAAALGVSQPALTGQLQRIEAALGGRLFVRDRQGVTPTPFGEFVLSRARAVLANVDEILEARPRGSAVASARVGGAANPLMAGFVDRLVDVLPGVPVSVQTHHHTRLLLDLVASGRLDCSLVSDYPGHELGPHADVRHAVVQNSPVFAALPATHRLAGEKQVRLADLAGEAWVLPPSDGTGWPEHLFEACEAAGFTPEAPYQVAEAGLRLELVAAGRAVSACQPEVRPGDDVVVRPFADDPLWMRHVLAWNPLSALAAHSATLVDLVRQAGTTAAAASPTYSEWLRRRAGG